MPILIEGGKPLFGTVESSGARNSALKLIYASMFSNEDIYLENVPRLESIYVDLEIIRSIGGKADWVRNNTLVLNGANLNSHEIPYELGSKYRTTFLLAGPLLFRFGKASLPRFVTSIFKPSPINRIVNTWRSLGISVEEDENYIHLKTEASRSTDIAFKTTTHMGTDNAILSALFVPGDTVINNASEEPEVDDLIDFCNKIGGHVERVEPRKIKVVGTNIFRGTHFQVMSDKAEIVAFSVAALLTNGNIVIRNVDKSALTSFVNFLTKVDANFEFSKDDLRIWHSGSPFTPVDINVSPSPGFVPDWMSYAILLLSQSNGVSLVHDTVYTDRFEFTKDLNRMGARIELIKPSSIGVLPVISDDSYDFDKFGEPSTVARVSGPTKLKGEKIHIIDYRFFNTLVVAALIADGRSELHGFKPMFESIENFLDKLVGLGAELKEN
ncbi:UDP-N-acetylglucosamine 1-carboxyvinyltransferase [candidate division WWE3 bacterium]|uniref:UDP-N-acetylglucosamine 1-carboxyvinyltransferase n=1 Tax=candidate division WWE3 bacterium TaxID=2053526 RepID=A0A3A4ZG00_UNCKA|nr:MAG: UDP-N-acetylglucosamine 1-carboxyvinyltransferase [candidate division WWE3 bacterium]